MRNLGPVTTFGANDMVLDNWGRVERWNAKAKVTSYGPNGIGFVNLGELGALVIDALLETHGLGACGFNCGEVKDNTAETSVVVGSASQRYDGTVRQAIFERVRDARRWRRGDPSRRSDRAYAGQKRRRDVRRRGRVPGSRMWS